MTKNELRILEEKQKLNCIHPLGITEDDWNLVKSNVILFTDEYDKNGIIEEVLKFFV